MDVNQKQCILTILQNPKYAELISYQEVCGAFRALGIPEGRPSNKQNLHYDDMSLKSIRIINRLIIYLSENKVEFNDFMSGLVSKQGIKTKTGISEVEIFKASNFFQKLHQLNLKKSPEVCENLCQILCIDQKYTSHLMLKKLRKCISDFSHSGYFSAIGVKKNKIDLEQY